MILLVGGTGVLGSEVARLLAARGDQLRVLTRDPARATHLAATAEVVRGDVRDPTTLPAALAGVTTVVLAAHGFAPADGGSPGSVDRDGTRAVLAASGELSRVVLLSVLGAGPGHPMELARMKYAAEQAVQDWSRSGAPGTRTCTILRPAAFLETWLTLVGMPLLAGKPAVIFGRGRNPINFVAARDVARCTERAAVTAELTGQRVNLTGPADLTLRELAATMASAAGCRLSVRRVPLPVMRLTSHLLRPAWPGPARLIRAGVIMDTADMTGRDAAGAVAADDLNGTTHRSHTDNTAFPKSTVNLPQPTTAAEIAKILATARG